MRTKYGVIVVGTVLCAAVLKDSRRSGGIPRALGGSCSSDPRYSVIDAKAFTSMTKVMNAVGQPALGAWGPPIRASA